jgi:hypothetical protein
MTTFLAPASLAICMISFDVVPRTIESSTISTFLSLNSSAMALSFRLTFFRLCAPLAFWGHTENRGEAGHRT